MATPIVSITPIPGSRTKDDRKRQDFAESLARLWRELHSCYVDELRSFHATRLDEEDRSFKAALKGSNRNWVEASNIIISVAGRLESLRRLAEDVESRSERTPNRENRIKRVRSRRTTANAAAAAVAPEPSQAAGGRT